MPGFGVATRQEHPGPWITIWKRGTLKIHSSQSGCWRGGGINLSRFKPLSFGLVNNIELCCLKFWNSHTEDNRSKRQHGIAERSGAFEWAPSWVKLVTGWEAAPRSHLQPPNLRRNQSSWENRLTAPGDRQRETMASFRVQQDHKWLELLYSRWGFTSPSCLSYPIQKGLPRM